MLDAFLDAGIDSVKLLPFLFLTYLAMEWMEHLSGNSLQRRVSAAGKWGPLWGSFLGVVPQCGFSASSASLYSGRVITVGTLIAVFLSTSDEMLPILISKEVSTIVILRILGAKVLIGMISGFFVEYIWTVVMKKREGEVNIHKICEHEHCNCNDGVIKSALKHTGTIFFTIFLISFLLNMAIQIIGEPMIVRIFSMVPVVGEMVAALVGMIPNCASSVIITELYIQGMIDSGAMMAGLLCNAGVGMLVLFRLNESKKESVLIFGMIYLLSVFWGILIHFSGLSF